ncbi:hypothetical protein PV08_06375 [Exophiala spinifera]|uniref:BZIP domain-containing protein n=1 Tax=Exophiala spinifera TaxID=91928 RepID=A0A0D2BYC8_9EURO|nr:uncharacterized protein PV08_06375 [Exophiala spinifera]KIW16324.1 hypothetical protein PV08_06375 [Exophiala spinifera]
MPPHSRTFRERRDLYLKNLEKQVLRLQKSESDLQTQVGRLQRELAEATNRLAVIDSKRNGIAQYPSQNNFRADRNDSNSNNWEEESNTYVASNDFISPSQSSQSQPPYGSVSSGSDSGSAVVWVESQDDKPWQMHVQSKSNHHQPQSQWPLSPVSLQSENTNNTQSPQDWYPRQQFTGERQADGQVQYDSSQLPTNSILHLGSEYVSQLDLVVVGMEFVLKLERPCLPHIHQPDENGIQTIPAGHVHTATAALLCSDAVAPTQDICSHSWNAPKEILRRLLEASSALPVEESFEVTPIQVWHMITSCRGFASMKVEKLVLLSDRLLAQIKCYGFGAVLRQDHIAKMLVYI